MHAFAFSVHVVPVLLFGILAVESSAVSWAFVSVCAHSDVIDVFFFISFFPFRVLSR